MPLNSQFSDGSTIYQAVYCTENKDYSLPYIFVSQPIKFYIFHIQFEGFCKRDTAAELRLQTVTMKPYVNEVTLREQKPPLKCC